MGQIPWFDEIWNKNSFMALLKPPTGFGVLKIVDKLISERTTDSQDKIVSEEQDMLSQFLKIQASNSEVPSWLVDCPILVCLL
jgi:hypothetical protein